MDLERFQHYLTDSSHRGAAPDGAVSDGAGGVACGDAVRFSLVAEGGTIQKARFEAEGCGATIASAAAVAELVEGSPVLDAALLNARAVSDELGGLSPGKVHAAELAADALHRTLTAVVSTGASLSSTADPDRVLVAMSGGVDSAVAALLERRAGREVVGVTVKLWADQITDGERSCCSPEAVLGARSLAHSLGIPHLTMDLEDRFRRAVVEEFVSGHAAGRTPNPCVRCNGSVRIDAMIGLAERVGASRLVTGHYARIVDDGEGPLLAMAPDRAKDQSYMLAALEPASLERLGFPLSTLTKPEVREIAQEAGLPVASKAESQDLCFLAGNGKREFLAKHGGIPDSPGRIVDSDGRELGGHSGAHNFTVGQRRGIGVAAPEPLYVLQTDAGSNTVTVGRREELAVERVAVTGAVLHRDGSRVSHVKLRYRSTALPCTVESEQGEPIDTGRHPSLVLALSEPAYGVAPGQSACLLDGETVVGWGTIESSGPAG